MRSLLLIIDLQKGWRHKTATEAAFQSTLKLAKTFPGDIVHCCFRNQPGSLFQTQIHWTRFRAPRDIDLIPEIEPLKLPVYWRTTYSCVTDELLPVFRKYDHVYITGVFTDISVAATAMELFDLDIPVSVVRDCVATLHGEDVHKAALASLGHAIGRHEVLNASAVLAAVQA